MIFENLETVDGLIKSVHSILFVLLQIASLTTYTRVEAYHLYLRRFGIEIIPLQM